MWLPRKGLGKGGAPAERGWFRKSQRRCSSASCLPGDGVPKPIGAAQARREAAPVAVGLQRALPAAAGERVRTTTNIGASLGSWYEPLPSAAGSSICYGVGVQQRGLQRLAGIPLGRAG